MSQSLRATPEEVIRRRIEALALRRKVARFFGLCAIVVVLLEVLFRCYIGVMVVERDDMKPFLVTGDIALYDRRNNEWNMGDVVVLEKDGHQHVGRIVARQGDIVDLRDGMLWIDGARVVEEEIYYDSKAEGKMRFPLAVGDGEYLVLGDHRDDCVDGREYGLVEKDCFRGKILAVFRNCR